MNRFVAILLVLACVHLGWKYLGSMKVVNARGEVSKASLNALATTAKAEDEEMYSTTECGHCTQAKGWLNQYGFAFIECNMSVSKQCEREFKGYGATGTPFLIVRAAQMKDGFNSEQFLALLKNRAAMVAAGEDRHGTKHSTEQAANTTNNKQTQQG